MLSLFAAQGLIQQNGGVWILTLRGREHLSSKSPWNLSPYYTSMKDRQPTLDMLKVLKTGKPANWGSYDPQAWAQAMERADFAASFTAAMDCRGILLGPALAKKLDLSEHQAVLDIAGGSGIYACAIKARHPHVKTTVFERPPVDRIARECIAKHGVEVDVVAGDMFKDELPEGYDVHLWSNVLHDWDDATVRTLLAKSTAALPAGGLIVIHDAFLNKEKTGPLHVAEYSALLMNITEGRCYGLGEMAKMLFDAGFDWVAHEPTAVSRSFIVARKS
jgi:predicted O-methyltransferase YrrM